MLNRAGNSAGDVEIGTHLPSRLSDLIAVRTPAVVGYGARGTHGRIAERRGKVLDEPFYDNVKNTSFQFLEQGLYCIEFHPKFKENGLFYVSYADMWFNGSTFIVEYKVSANDPNKADMNSARPVMRIDFPYCNHHGGKIAFGPDGYLYVGVGDGGWEGDVLNTGQDISTWMGKMLRIDPHGNNSANGQYGIPADNPFVATPGARGNWWTKVSRASI